MRGSIVNYGIAKLAGVVFASVLLCCGSARGDINLGGGRKIVFASAEKGREILTRRDEFIDKMSPLDRRLRLNDDREVSREKLLANTGKAVLSWSQSEQESITEAIEPLASKLDLVTKVLPENLYLIKTTGKEEFGAAYTRQNAIVLAEGQLGDLNRRMVQGLIVHELFHVISRANPKLRSRLYGVIGFKKCNEIELPSSIAGRKVTNPDAIWNDHYIEVKLAGKQVRAIPVIYTRTDRPSIASPDDLLRAIDFRLLLVQQAGDGQGMRAMCDDKGPRLVEAGRVGGYFEQIGSNTPYIIHPDEILADNFTLLIAGGRGKPKSPEIIEGMEKVLRQWKKPAATGH